MEGKDGRRRFVQKTLFPHMESAIKEGEKVCGRREEEAEVEEEERCGSGKKRKATKMNGNSKFKTPPRASSKKVIENGKVTSSKQVDDTDSPVIANASFFVKASERRQQKRQQNQLVFIDSPEENDEFCSTPSSVASGSSTPQKPKQQNKSTPRKGKRGSTPNKKMKSGKRALCFGQVPSDLPVDEQQSLKVPDLRLEAKLTAEENSRIFAGRQIHPFFTSRKGGKSSQEFSNSESKWTPSGIKEKGIAFNPIHVFEDLEDDPKTLNWGDWVFSERSDTGDFPSGRTPVYEGCIDSLNFDNYLNISHFTRTSICQNSHLCSVPEMGFYKALPDNPELSHTLSSLSFSDERERSSAKEDSDMLPKYAGDILAAAVESMLQDHKCEKNDCVDGTPCGGNMESELQDKLLRERIMSNYHTCQNQPENCIWTDKYQPQNAKKICGNGESVKLLSEWLHLWHKRGSLTIRDCIDDDNSIAQDVDHDYELSDSDDNGEESLKNVLLVTGPVGSGKSAAIYACARDQGFQIIEINASDWRNGALVKQKFGEAVESHWLQRTVDNEINSDNKSLSKFYKAVNAETQSSDDEVIELQYLPDKEDSGAAGSSPNESVPVDKRTVNCPSEVKTLILFEDVDATLCEDHGFITTIQQLAETAKRPMILTSNSDNPPLPKNLDRLELSFSVPSVEELLGLVYTISAAEKAEIHPCLLERFVDYCRGDVRKTILLLQFWCQGQTLGRGNELQTTYGPVLFDLDAGHHILPKVINWGYPSQLSELVAEEVDRSLTLMEETQNLTGRIEVENLNYNSSQQDIEPDPVELKKATMLSLQCPLDEDEFTRFEAYSELFDISCSPILSAQKNRRRKINTVLSSDDEDDPACGSIPLVSAGVDINAEAHEMKNLLTFNCLSTELCEPLSEPILNSEAGKFDDCCQLSLRVDHSHMEDTCGSQEMSCVAESFVPETEIIQETELFSTTVTYSNFGNAIDLNAVYQDEDSMSILKTAGGAQSLKPLHTLQNGKNNFDTSTPCVYQEEVGDSLSKSEADVPRGFQMLDECSRVDFIRKLKSLDDPETDQSIDVVEETWKRLHDECKDLKKYVTQEEKRARKVLEFVHGMSSLISETDLLLKGCQTLACDSLSPSMIPSEKTHSYSYYDNQLEMSSVLAQHGMCFYAKEIASLDSNLGSPNTLDLASKMLHSSSSSVALGKLANQDRRRIVYKSSTKTMKTSIFLTSNSDSSCLQNILQSIVPSKAYLAAKGDAFHEYVSTLSQISRAEASRSSECVVGNVNGNRRNPRRYRTPPHYLSSGSLAMSSEEIALLGRYGVYPKVPSPGDALN
ncbi:hypothetical protein ACS0TY_027763 [Phlomoides rotata]